MLHREGHEADGARLKVAVTMEPESWLLRRFGGYFQRFASERLDCRLLELNEPVPEDTGAVIYANWPHIYQCPLRHRQMPGVLMVGHMDHTAFRFRYLLWRHPNLHVVCMAERWVRALRRYCIPLSRLHLIPHGIDLEMFRPSAMVPAGRRTRIGFVGRAYPEGRKGEDRLLAISRLLAKEDYEFVLVGERWEQVVTALRASGFAVTYHRQLRTSEVSGVVAGLDVLLVCARNEGGPQPVLEALACGVPVVSTEVGFVTDLQAILPRQITVFERQETAVKALAKARQNRQRAQADISSTRQKLAPYTWQIWANDLEKLSWKIAGKQVPSPVAIPAASTV